MPRIAERLLIYNPRPLRQIQHVHLEDC
uniref:Uncharacterized protein n=1 Tax=Anguilla anguilla TaxID=7936 RepID=A0A0E9TQR6_ANGAN